MAVGARLPKRPRGDLRILRLGPSGGRAERASGELGDEVAAILLRGVDVADGVDGFGGG